ncbi:alpha/beta hydrolase family protein [uncultured Corynebacterium sp.]|uniref:alpha/beta hydrolase n=1 Tax=uncultured Corynebacterium sp. TaxID=159447 RepID=UPI002593DAFB|nr:alpha/beta hydrolase family protein [uncultured Corynebacterium sp.]
MSIKRSVVAVAAALTLALGLTPATASAQEGTVKSWDAPSDPPLVVGSNKPQSWVEQVDHQQVLSYKVFSPSMNRDVPVAVIPATDSEGQRVKNAPIIYLLNGAGGAEQDADWLTRFGTRDFFAGKGVNVVIPQAGAFSYYTDWVRDDVQSLYINGPQKWETFLTEELPGPMERTLNADQRRSIVGFSMSGTSSLVLPTHKPGFYKSAASFSGCAATASPQAFNYARLTVNRASGTGDFRTVTPEMMWGPMGGPYNGYNDALANAEQLRGTALYVSTGTGLASETDMVGYLMGQGAPAPAASIGAAQLQIEGGAIEAAINQCSHDLRAKLEKLNIPAHYEFRNTGTHSWPMWREDIQKAWFTTIAPSFGM